LHPGNLTAPLVGPTVELTRRREFIQAAPDESSYETRSRRLRSTIYWASLVS